MKYVCIALYAMSLGFLLGCVVYKFIVIPNSDKYEDINVVRDVTKQDVIDSIESGKTEFEGSTIQLYAVVKSRNMGHNSIMLEGSENDRFWWYIRTDEPRENQWYDEDKRYRFKLYIREIQYEQDDNRHIIWSEIVE